MYTLFEILCLTFYKKFVSKSLKSCMQALCFFSFFLFFFFISYTSCTLCHTNRFLKCLQAWVEEAGCKIYSGAPTVSQIDKIRSMHILQTKLVRNPVCKQMTIHTASGRKVWSTHWYTRVPLTRCLHHQCHVVSRVHATVEEPQPVVNINAFLFWNSLQGLYVACHVTVVQTEIYVHAETLYVHKHMCF